MDIAVWPRLSDATAILPRIRHELVVQAATLDGTKGREIALCAIVEDGLFGYELVPSMMTLPFLIMGCAENGIPRLRRTLFDPTRDSGLRLAALHGRALRGTRPRMPKRSRQDEALYADWPTAAAYAWKDLSGAVGGDRTTWDACMAECRSLENALAIASLHLAEWDPGIDFWGLSNQAELGLPLRGMGGESGTLTRKRPDIWVLSWVTKQTNLTREWSIFQLAEETREVARAERAGSVRDARR